MSDFSFLTIALPAEGSYKEKGSRFFAFAYPVGSEEEIKERIEAMKKEYYDASHHCFACLFKKFEVTNIAQLIRRASKVFWLE